MRIVVEHAETPTVPRLRIAVLNRCFAPRCGGAERYSIKLCEALAQRHEIHVFAQEIDAGLPGLHYHRVPRPLRRMRWLNQLFYAAWTAWATRHGFDVVHSHENTWVGEVQTIHVLPVRIGLFQNRNGQPLRGLRRFGRALSLIFSPRLLTYWLLEAARFRPRAGRVIVAVSETLRERMARAYPGSAAHFAVIPPGVEPPPQPLCQTQSRTRLGLPQSGPLLLFVGNDYAKKGLKVVLDAMRGLPETVHLAVVGDPARIPPFRERAQNLGLESRVHFLGAVGDIDAAYAAADLLVHPTTEDTFGMVILEAMAHALPVVVSAAPWCGAAAELADGEEAQLLADPGDAHALAGAVTRILSDPPLRERLRRGGQAVVVRHAWDALARAQEEIYRKIVAGRDR